MKLATLVRAAWIAVLATVITSCSSLGSGRSPADRRPNTGSQSATARVQYLR
jgi:hypothetical protein